MSIKVVLFGSFYRGFAVLNELTSGPLSDKLEITGIATDNPTQPFVNAKNRVWQYGYTPAEADMVKELAQQNDIPVYQGKVKSEEFYNIYENQYKPDICIMATFGQLINQRLFSYPKLGFYNIHPSDNSVWPSVYAGPNPFFEMLHNDEKSCVLSLHHVDGNFDTGARVAVSETIYFPPKTTPKTLHKMSSPIAALLVREYLKKILEAQDA